MRSMVRRCFGVAGVFALVVAPTALGDAPPDTPIVPSPLRMVQGQRPTPATALALDLKAYAALKKMDEMVLTGFHLDAETPVDLSLRRFDVFADDARLVMASPDGDMVLARPDVVLLRGAIAGQRGSTVFLSLSPHGSSGVIRTAQGRYIISSGQGGKRLPTVIYNLDALPDGAITWRAFNCSTDLLDGGGRPVGGGVGGIPTVPCRRAEIALETDWQFTGNLFGGDTDASGAYAATLIAAISEIYSRDVNATFEIGFLRLWSDPNDPWDQGNTIDQLYQFRDYWEANMSDVPRHVAHFLSGRGLGGGVAWLPGLCQGEYAYGLSANLNGFFPYPLEHNNPQNWDPFVVSHELGHNFGAPHTHSMDPPIDGCGSGDCTDASDGTIMSYCHLCDGGYSNIRLEFHQRMIDEAILPYLADDAPCDLTIFAPHIVQQPSDQTVCESQDVTFTVTVAGTEPISYQWRKDGADIPGANESSYSILSVIPADAGQYDVLIANKCNEITSEAATLTVVTSNGADLNCDGVVDPSDLALLLGCWGTACADLNGDGTTDPADLAILLANWG